MEETHVYTVTPRRPIRGLVKGKVIIKPTDLSLTKEEVLMCLKHGAVYRKFYLDGSEKVTPSNLDRLHRSEHLTEEQYKALCEKLNAEDDVVEEETEVVSEEPKAEVEETTEDLKKEEEEQLSIENSDAVEQQVEETPVEEEATKPKKKKKSTKKKVVVEEEQPSEEVTPEETPEE